MVRTGVKLEGCVQERTAGGSEELSHAQYQQRTYAAIETESGLPLEYWAPYLEKWWNSSPGLTPSVNQSL